MVRVRVVTLLWLVLLLGPGRASAAPGDEFWDARFGVPGSDGVALAMAAGDRGLYVGGMFGSVDDLSAMNIARWDGKSWYGVGGGIGGVTFAHVTAFATRGHELFAGGYFFDAGGVAVSHVARWDGTNWTSMNGGLDGVVFSLAIDGSDLYVGGTFGLAGAVEVANIARWDGTNWWALGGGVAGVVYALAARDGVVYAGGRFLSAGGTMATNIARWDGTDWSALGYGVRNINGGDGGMASVRGLGLAGSNVYVGGSFKLAGGIGATNIAKWDGEKWSSFGRGASGTVNSFVFNGEEVFAVGSFVFMDGVYVRGVARLAEGSWSALGSGFFYGAPGPAAGNGSELFFGGDFTQAGGKPSQYIAMWHIPYTLSVSRAGNAQVLSWPATGTNFLLESTTNLAAPVWAQVAQPPVIVNNQCVVTNPATASSQYFRLRRR